MLALEKLNFKITGMNLKDVQKRIFDNKIKKGFNTTDVRMEFLFLYEEVAEAYEAYWKKKDDLGGELADVAIYLMAISEMLGFDLGEEIDKKMDINEKRVYKEIDGVLKKVD
jgi:NTP pyrophosphatase (non-canonical NTP hydrolase)